MLGIPCGFQNTHVNSFIWGMAVARVHCNSHILSTNVHLQQFIQLTLSSSMLLGGCVCFYFNSVFCNFPWDLTYTGLLHNNILSGSTALELRNGRTSPGYIWDQDWEVATSETACLSIVHKHEAQAGDYNQQNHKVGIATAISLPWCSCISIYMRHFVDTCTFTC